MSETIYPTVYFQKPGRANSERTLEIARARAEQLSIGTILVATTTGATGARAGEVFQGFDVVAVTHSYGFRDANTTELLPEHRAAMEAAGVTILTCGHAFAGISRAVRKRMGTYEVAEIVAFTLRTFGEGMKVVAEIACMAADAGLARTDELVLAIGGTGRGADTAVVLRPANTEYFFDMKFEEILCMPYR
jgi:hypothetical protein